jgi:ribonuclease VapC
MIAVDTSAIIAILLNEPQSDACIDALEREDEIVISAGTLAETLILAGRRNIGTEAARLFDGLGVEIVPMTPAAARRVAQAYEAWGKGSHPGGLNFGDCFAYSVAKEYGCPLLFVGEGFTATDIAGVL